MGTRALKTANILIALGIGLLLLGIALSYPTFLPYFETRLQTAAIVAASPLESVVVAADATVMALLPFEELPPVTMAEVLPTAMLLGALRAHPNLPQSAPLLLDPTSEAPTRGLSPSPAMSQPVGAVPMRIRIPSIRLDAPVVPADWEVTQAVEGAQGIWQVPNWRAVGWHGTSALLGVSGNTVLNGHNTTYGEVFRDLYKLKEGAEILLVGEDGLTYTYQIKALYNLKEANQPLEVRLENARYILPTTDERLTLVTCHPYGSLQNRLIVIARPAGILPMSEGE